MNEEDYEIDRHAFYREKKLNSRGKQKLLRGNMSIYELQKGIVKRGKDGKQKQRST